MSKTARRNFKSQAARVTELIAQEEGRLLSGPARNRVTGAGKHLRYITPAQERNWVIRDFRMALKEVGLPENQLWFSPKDETMSVNEMRRIAGWIRACLLHKPAMVVLDSLYSRNNGRGIGSPSHLATCYTIPWLMKLWASPGLITRKQANGLRWLIKASRHTRHTHYHKEKYVVSCVVNRVKNVKLLHELVRVSPLARWVLTANLPVAGDLTHRDLNWGLLSKLNRTQMLEYVPPPIRVTLAWLDHGVHVPKGFGWEPRGLAIKTFKTILQYIGVGGDKGVDKTVYTVEVLDAIGRLVLMFGRDIQGSIRYLESYMGSYMQDLAGKRCHVVRYMAVHDAAQKLPTVKVHPDWKPFVVSQFTSRDFGVIMDNLERVEEVCGGVPRTVGETRVRFLQAGVPWEFDLNSTEKAFIRTHEGKGFEMCPHVEISSGEYSLKKLDANDTRQLTAGRLTDCCQHLEGAGAACAQAAWTSGGSGVYAVFKGERMVAQTFAWRASDGSLVFDSIEALRDVNRAAVLPLFAQSAAAVLGRLGVTRVLVGVTNYGITREFTGLLSETRKVETPDCVFHLGYSDAREGCWIVCEVETSARSAANFEYPSSVVHPLPEVNQLMGGSGVLCEHCGVEVHPACVICPNCGEDISEWVD